MVSRHPANFGAHRHCGSGNVMFLVSEEENSRCCHFNPSLLFISKAYGLFHLAYHIINSDPGHMCAKQLLEIILKYLLLVLPKALMRRKKRRK